MRTQNMLIVFLCALVLLFGGLFVRDRLFSRAQGEILLVKASASPAAETTKPPLRIDINTADKALLTELPGIGEAYAEAIIEYREAQGGFKQVEELLEVRGIGEKTLENLLPIITALPPPEE